MKPQDYKMLHEDEQSFHVRHPDGSKFKVAKNHLTSDTHDKIKKFYRGGMVEHYADGGEVSGDEGDDSALDRAKELAGSDKANTEALVSQETPQVPPTVANPVMIGQQPQEPESPMAGPLAEYQKAFEEEKGGIQAQAEATGKLGESVASQYAKSAKGLDDLMADYKLRQYDRDAEAQRLKADILSNKIDPNRLWSNASTGQKVGAMVGILLGGIGGGGRSNMALDTINNLISRDVDAQKTNVGVTKSLLDYNMKQAADDREATLLTHRQLLDATQAEVQRQQSLAQTPLAQAQAQVLSAGIDKQKAAIDQQLFLYNMQAKLRTSPFKKELIGYLDPKDAQNTVILPDGQTAVIANNEKARDEAREAIAANQPLMDTLNKIESVRNAVVPFGQKAEQVRSLIPSAILQLRTAQKLNRLSPEAVKLLEQQFANPTEFLDAVRGPAKTEALKSTLNNQLDSVLKSALPAYQSPNSVPGARPK